MNTLGQPYANQFILYPHPCDISTVVLSSVSLSLSSVFFSLFSVLCFLPSVFCPLSLAFCLMSLCLYPLSNCRMPYVLCPLSSVSLSFAVCPLFLCILSNCPLPYVLWPLSFLSSVCCIFIYFSTPTPSHLAFKVIDIHFLFVKYAFFNRIFTRLQADTKHKGVIK